MAPPAATFATALEAMLQALYETWMNVGGYRRMSRRRSAFQGASRPKQAEAAPNERDGIGWKRPARSGV